MLTERSESKHPLTRDDPARKGFFDSGSPVRGGLTVAQNDTIADPETRHAASRRE